MSPAQIIKSLEKLTVDNSPLILTGLGVAGVITTAVFTGKATLRADAIIREHEAVYGTAETSKQQFVERFKLVWPLYIPPVTNGIITISLIIAANRIGTRRAAALAAAYTVSEKTFSEYREKIIEKFGANKEREARDDIAQDHLNRTPASGTQIIITDGGDHSCFDQYTGRYFKSNMQTILAAVNGINHTITHFQYASLNDFYNRLGLPNIPVGEEVGWKDNLLEIRTSTCLDDSEKPCLVIEFTVEPVRKYFRVH